jgi:hypothetical protein
MSVVGMSSDMELKKASAASLLSHGIRVRCSLALYLSHAYIDNSIVLGGAIIRGPAASD